MPYQNSGDITLNDGSDPLNKFMMAGIEFTQGVIFHSTQSDDTDINFNLGKGFTTMTFTAGHIDIQGNRVNQFIICPDIDGFLSAPVIVNMTQLKGNHIEPAAQIKQRVRMCST